jgi:hypothetical protein
MYETNAFRGRMSKRKNAEIFTESTEPGVPMTNGEKQEQAKLARRLHENGVLINCNNIYIKSKLIMRQIGEPSDSRAIDLGNRTTGFIIKVNMHVLSSNMAIEDIYLEVPWRDYSVRLLSDPVEIGAGYCNYRFFGSHPFELERGQVLNHRAVRTKPFRPGTALQGLILWSGLEEIPDAFEHGGSLPARVTVFDQFGDEFAYEFNLWIDRRNKWLPAKRPKRLRVPLFAKKDAMPKAITINSLN